MNSNNDLSVPVINKEDNIRLWENFIGVRTFSETLCKSLVTEDYVIQSMPDVSPTKWHLAHTSWFFETQDGSLWVSDSQRMFNKQK